MSKKVLRGVTDLSSQKPDVAKDWDYSKNSKTPGEVSQYSNKTAWWVCNELHSWESVIANRSKGSGCPECAKTTRGENISKAKNISNKPLYGHKELKKEFCIVNSYNPYIKGNSYQSKVLWICSECSKSWVAKISKRIKGSGCPNCWKLNKGKEYVKSIVRSKGSLFYTNPEVQEYWDYEKNKLHKIYPEKFSAGSHSYAYWFCPKCKHSWRAIIKSVAIKGSRCSKCMSKTSKGEEELFNFVRSLYKDAIKNDRKIVNPKELDIYIPSKKVAIEYNGEYWHSNEVMSVRINRISEEYHREKIQICEAYGIDLLFVWEDDWLRNKDTVKELIIRYFDNRQKNSIFKRLISNRDL